MLRESDREKNIVLRKSSNRKSVYLKNKQNNPCFYLSLNTYSQLTESSGSYFNEI